MQDEELVILSIIFQVSDCHGSWDNWQQVFEAIGNLRFHVQKVQVSLTSALISRLYHENQRLKLINLKNLKCFKATYLNIIVRKQLLPQFCLFPQQIGLQYNSCFHAVFSNSQGLYHAYLLSAVFKLQLMSFVISTRDSITQKAANNIIFNIPNWSKIQEVSV